MLGLSDECFGTPTATINCLNPFFIYFSTQARVKFHESCLKQKTHEQKLMR